MDRLEKILQDEIVSWLVIGNCAISYNSHNPYDKWVVVVEATCAVIDQFETLLEALAAVEEYNAEHYQKIPSGW